MEGTTAKQLEKKSKQKQREMDSVLSSGMVSLGMHAN